MAFENNPNATATGTVSVPAHTVDHPATVVYSESFSVDKGGWAFATPATSDYYWPTGGRTSGRYTLYVDGTTYLGKATRTVTGLVVGATYTLAAWAGTATTSRQVRVGVAGLSSGSWVSGWTSTYSWKQATFTFTATATSHALVLEGAKLASGSTSNTIDWDDVTLTRSPWTEYVPEEPSFTYELGLTEGDLTLDAARYPYVQGNVEVPLTTDDLLEQIEPGQRVVIKATSKGTWDQIHTPWAEQRRNRVPNPDQLQTGSATWVTGAGTGVYTSGKYISTAAGGSTFYQYPVPIPADATGARFTVSSGQKIAFRARVDNPNDFPIWARAGHGWYQASGGSVTADGVVQGPILQVNPGETIIVEAVGVVPNGVSGTLTGTLPLVYIYANAEGGLAAAGTLGDTTEWALYTGPTAPDSPVPALIGGVDGDLYRERWTGTANASPTVIETRSIASTTWVPEAGITADLSLRERKVSHDGKTIQLRLESDESLLDSWADIADDSTPRTHEANLRNLVNYVLGKAIPGAALQPGTTNADVTAQWDATNLLKNPDAATTVANWAGGSSATTIAHNTGAGQGGTAGFIRATQTGTTGAVFLATTNYDIPAREGQMFTASVYAKHSVAGASMSITIRFLDTNNVILRNVVSAITPMPTAWGTRWSVTGVAPANTVRVVPYVSISGSASGRTWDLDKAMLTDGPVLLPFFDGNTANTANYTYVWDDVAGASTSSRVATPERLPELFTWEAGTTAWEFLSPLVASAGFRLFCDEQRRWWLINPNDFIVPGRFSARPDNTVEGTDTMDADDDESGYTGVVVVFKWTDPDGTSRTKKDAAGSAGKVKVLEFDRQYPGPGVAAAHLAKVQGLGRVQDVTVSTDYDVRPGMEVQIDLPGTYPQLGTLSRVRFELMDGLMAIGSSGLRETPPGAIDLLSGTIDALPGTIDSL